MALVLDQTLRAGKCKMLHENSRDLSSKRFPKPDPILSLLLGLPVQLLVGLLAKLPWMAGLVGIVITEPVKNIDGVCTIITCFAQSKRVAFQSCIPSLSQGASCRSRAVCALSLHCSRQVEP